MLDHTNAWKTSAGFISANGQQLLAGLLVLESVAQLAGECRLGESATEGAQEEVMNLGLW